MGIINISSHNKTSVLHCAVGLLLAATAATVFLGGVGGALGDSHALAAAWLAIKFDVLALGFLSLFLKDDKPLLRQWLSAAQAHFYPNL